MNITNRFFRSAAVVTLTCVLIGCGGGKDPEVPTGDVEGTVTLGGKPLTQGRISFYNPENGNSGGGMIGAGGKFKFDIPVNVGTYQVAVLPPEAPQPDDEASGKKAQALAAMIPAGYQDGGSSGLTAEVKEGPNSYKFELRKSGPPPTYDNQTPP